jgi:hypothetical protein
MNFNCSKCLSTMNEYKFVYNEDNGDIGQIKTMEDNIIKEITIDAVCENTKSEIMNMDCVIYCTNCYFVCAFPSKYIDNEFLTKCDNVIDYYDNFLKDNIIHNFTNINCENCSNILNQGKFTIEIIEETQENFNNLSMPNDFIKNIMVYDNNNNLIYSIEPKDYNEYKELIEFNTDISKNLLYCSNCNYIILNNLKKIKRYDL